MNYYYYYCPSVLFLLSIVSEFSYCSRLTCISERYSESGSLV